MSRAATSTSSVVLVFENAEEYCNELWQRFSDAASLPSYEQTDDVWDPFFEISDFSSPTYVLYSLLPLWSVADVCIIGIMRCYGVAVTPSVKRCCTSTQP